MRWLWHFVLCAFGKHEWGDPIHIYGQVITCCYWCEAKK